MGASIFYRLGVHAGAALVAGLALVAPARAQTPFRPLDPFYQGESAQREFFGEVAVSGELHYRSADLLQPAPEARVGNPFAVSVRLDYALLPQVDVSGIVDLSGGLGRGPVGLSWVVLKPYWHNDGTDYAVRIAVDPASEGGLGFRQTDVAFLSTSTLSPEWTSDFALGVRRVRTGFETTLLDEADAFLRADGERVRVIGRELHATWGYNAVFDPAGSRVSLALLAEAGDYTLVTSGPAQPPVDSTAGEERVRSGIGWLQAGVEWSRPSYQIAPFLSVPLVTWAVVRGEPVRHGPRPDHARFGLRLTIR